MSVGCGNSCVFRRFLTFQTPASIPPNKPSDLFLLISAYMPHTSPYNLSGTRANSSRHHHANVDARIDPGMHAIPHDHAEFSPAGVNRLALHNRTDVPSVMPQVCNLRSGAEVAATPDDAIPDITEMTDVCPVHHDAVFDLNSIPDAHVISYSRTRSDKAVRTDIAVLSDDHRSCDVRAVSDDAALPDPNIAVQRGVGLDIAKNLGLNA